MDGIEEKRELDYDLAIECFKRVIEITETPANIPINYSMIGAMYFKKGDPIVGEEMIMKAIENLPDDAPEAEKESYLNRLKQHKEKFGNR